LVFLDPSGWKLSFSSIKAPPRPVNFDQKKIIRVSEVVWTPRRPFPTMKRTLQHKDKRGAGTARAAAFLQILRALIGVAPVYEDGIATARNAIVFLATRDLDWPSFHEHKAAGTSGLKAGGDNLVPLKSKKHGDKK
jgi:hypothetical protein